MNFFQEVRGKNARMNKYEMFGFMSVAEHKDAPDGAWWAILEDAARMYADMYGKTVDENQAVHDYIAWKKMQ